MEFQSELLDDLDSFEHRVNPESVIIQRLASSRWEEKLLAMIEMHITETGSRFGEVILADWQQNRGKFWQVCPREMIHRLDWPLTDPQAVARVIEHSSDLYTH
jgi:glutamate synthase (NADPH/NADH) large chain